MVGQSGNGRKRPIVIETRTQVDPANAERRSQNLPWEISRFVPNAVLMRSRAWTHGRSRRQRRDRRREKSAEAVVVRSSDDGANQSGQRTSGRPTIPRKSGEGPNLCCQGASRRRLDGFGATARRTRPIPTRGADGGGAPRRDRRRRNRSGSVRGVASIHGVRPSTSLDHGLDLGPDHGRDRNRVLDGKDLRWHEFAPSPSTGKGEQGGVEAQTG